MERHHVLIVYANGFQFDEEELQALRAEFPSCSFDEAYDDSVADEQLERAEIICGYPHPESVQKAKNLRWLQLSSIGVDKHGKPELYARPDAVLTNCHGNNGLPISDHVLGMMLALSRNFHYYRDQQNAHIWNKMIPTKDMFLSTVLIIGLGSVGQNIARKCKTLGMTVAAIDRSAEQKPEYVDTLETQSSLDELLPTADFVVLSVPATPETIGMMSRERLRLMRRDAYLINVGRGALIDREALIDSLKNEGILGAAIDVYQQEPVPENSPLWDLKNLIMTPHVAGKSPTAHVRHFNTFHDNLVRYLQNKPLQNTIDFNRHF